MNTTTLRVARLGNGSALHFVDDQGILCNRWGSVNGTVRSPKFVVFTTRANCKTCIKLAAK